MNQNPPSQASVQRTKLNRRIHRLAERQRQAELLLREIAFVLKMTERVRNEIVSDQEAEELVMA